MLEFTKMHGLGNDFVVVDGLSHPVELTAGLVRRIADRRRGVGCDQVLVLEPPGRDDCVCRYRVFNADGGEAEQCGNGVRCIGLFLVNHGLADGDVITLCGPAGTTRLEHAGRERFRVDMGPPRLDPADVPFQAGKRESVYPLEVGDRRVEISAVSMGNPHAVLLTDDVEREDVAGLGAAIEHHERFPARANVGFMQVLAPDRVRLRVHERGAGETMACGTGACAAVVAGRIRGLLAERVSVSLPGGTLVIEWNGEGDPVWMTGPATSVFEGILRP